MHGAVKPYLIYKAGILQVEGVAQREHVELEVIAPFQEVIRYGMTGCRTYGEVLAIANKTLIS